MLKVELNISEEDSKRVVKALERYISELGMEIADTDTMDYREELKSQRISIQRVLDQLKGKQS